MRFLFCVLLSIVTPAAWAFDAALVGKWKSGTGGDASVMEIKADGTAIMDGTAIKLQADGGKMKLMYQPGVVLDATYTVNATTLVIRMLNETETWQRIGAPAAPRSVPAPVQPPLSTPPVGNAQVATAPNASAATATPPTAGETDKGNWLRRSDEGFDLLLPGDFRIIREQGGSILLGSNVTPGLILVIPAPTGTPADLERAQKQGVQETGISMSPRGAARDAGVAGSTGKLIDVAGTLDQTRAQGLLGAFLRAEGTGGLAILAATTPESWPALKPFAEEAMRNVRFYKPSVSERLLKARQALAGRSLVTSFNSSTTSQNSSGYYTGSAVNSFRAWHCCASGRGRYEGARSSSFRGGGIIGASDSGPVSLDGTWDLQAQGNDFLLTFRFDRGGTASWIVTVDANENVFVDNAKVKVTTDSICNQL